MASIAIKIDEPPVAPSAEEMVAASHAARALSRLDVTGKSVQLIAQDAQSPSDPIVLPMSIFRQVMKLLVEIGNGNPVAVVPVHAELTTQQAADLLNVSRPHLVKLIDAGTLKFRMVGTHRKLQAKDVFNYRDQTGHARAEGLKSMVALDEELGLYDDEPVGGKD